MPKKSKKKKKEKKSNSIEDWVKKETELPKDVMGL